MGQLHRCRKYLSIHWNAGLGVQRPVTAQFSGITTTESMGLLISTSLALSIQGGTSMIAPPVIMEGDQELVVGLPFGLLPVSNRNLPLQMQTLKELTAKLLCAWHGARATDWSKKRAIHFIEGTQIFEASFDGQVQKGLHLVPLKIDESSPVSYKTCAFGCTKNQ